MEKPEVQTEPLVELAEDEAVVRALLQSAHPVEFLESAESLEEDSESA
jgi:hypothetical protein